MIQSCKRYILTLGLFRTVAVWQVETGNNKIKLRFLAKTIWNNSFTQCLSTHTDYEVQSRLKLMFNKKKITKGICFGKSVAKPLCFAKQCPQKVQNSVLSWSYQVLLVSITTLWKKSQFFGQFQKDFNHKYAFVYSSE